MDLIDSMTKGYQNGQMVTGSPHQGQEIHKNRYSSSSFRFQKKVKKKKVKASSSTHQDRLKGKMRKLIKESKKNETNQEPVRVKEAKKPPLGLSRMPMVVQSKVTYCRKLVLPDFLVFKNSSRELLKRLNIVETDENDDTESTYPLVKSTSKRVFRKMLQYLVDHDYVSEQQANGYIDQIRFDMDNERELVQQSEHSMTTKYVTLKEDEEDCRAEEDQAQEDCPLDRSIKSAPVIIGSDEDGAYEDDAISLL